MTCDLAPPNPLILQLVEVSNDKKSLQVERMWEDIPESIMAVGELKAL